MALLTPPPTAPQRGDRTTFANRVDAFITWLINFVSELIAFAANLNSIAAGGAYAIPYTYRAGSQFQASGNVLSFSGVGLGNATTANSLAVDTVVAGVDITSLILSMTASSSAVKGTLKVTKQNDASTWATFNITGAVQSSGFVTFSVTPVDSNVAYPFADYDPVILQFMRTGDKGDLNSLTNVLWVRDQKASGTAGGSSVAGTQARTLNTTVLNSISGASLASNQITLPAGTYRVRAVAPAADVSAHQLGLYSVTDSAFLLTGQSMYTSNAASNNGQALINMAQVTLSGTKVLELRHWTQSGVTSTGLGRAAGSTWGEVYAEIFIEKVA